MTDSTPHKEPLHAYGGVEHRQTGPFPECLLCEIDRLRRELGRIANAEWQEYGPMARRDAIRIAKEALDG